MAVIDAKYDLLEEMARNIFFKLPPFSDVREKITAAANLHDKYYVLGCFE